MTSFHYDANKGILWVLGLVDLAAGEPGTPVNTANLEVKILDEDDTQVWPTPSGTQALTALGAAVPVTIDGVTYADGNYSVETPDTIVWSTRANGTFKKHRAEITSDIGYAHTEEITPRTRK